MVNLPTDPLVQASRPVVEMCLSTFTKLQESVVTGNAHLLESDRARVMSAMRACECWLNTFQDDGSG